LRGQSLEGRNSSIFAVLRMTMSPFFPSGSLRGPGGSAQHQGDASAADGEGETRCYRCLSERQKNVIVPGE
jgi:hypothetical protein